jgi:iron complex outermembrane recepter protein
MSMTSTGVKSAMVGLLCAAPVLAQDEVVTHAREREMVVTATRSAEDAATVPGHVTVMSGEELRAGAHLSVADALRHLAGIHVRSSTGNPTGTEIGMRGFGENSHGRVLVLLDGRRLNRPDMAAIHWLQIAPNQVERIEVLRGGASALYGDHALAGVVNIVSRQGEEQPVTQVGVEAGSFETALARMATSGSVGAFTYAVSADRLQSDGYRDQSAYRAQGIGTRMGYALTPQASINASLGRRDLTFDMPGGMSREQMRLSPRSSFSLKDESEVNYLNAQVGLKIGQGRDWQIDADFFRNRRHTETDMASWFHYSDNTLDTTGGQLAYSREYPVGSLANRFTAGLDLQRDAMDAERFADATRSLQTVFADIEKNAVGLYVRNALTVAESVTVALGARHEICEIQGSARSAGLPTFAERDRHRATVADLSVVQTLADRSKLYAKFGTLYRYPFLDEQIEYTGFGSDRFHSDIDPEKGWNAEVGSRWNGALGWVEIALFHNEMQDEIAWNPAAFRNDNMDKTRRQGLETAFSLVPPASPVRLSGNYSFTEGVFADGPDKHNDIPLAPRHKASLSAALELPYRLHLSLVATYVGSSRLGGDNANNRSKLADYTVADMVLRYVADDASGLEVYAAVDNLFDKQYASLGYAGWADDLYYPAPGIGVRVGYGYRF